MTAARLGLGAALRACLALGLFTLAAPGLAEPPPRPIAFAIAAQPLAQALAEYSLVSGLTVLVDSALTEGRQAPAVMGNYAPGEALRKLLAGSSLAIRYASAQSFTLVAEQAPAVRNGQQARRLRDTQYAAALQGAVKRALCAAAGAEPGSYRALMQLWFDKAWRVSRVSWVASTGSPGLDGQLEAALRGVAVGPLPAGMPQPVTLLLEPRNAGDCAGMPGASRAR
ncbi:STN domain-containing protein [Achromobacter sp. NPDC058515]|uniref:STN domain-containing protein n=1 Tax=Achromobacter sp. NPDC058515 TaxID=3346533 RepID=UPI0036539F23